MTYRNSTDDEVRRAFDPYVHAITIIDEEHRLIHDGCGFQGDVVQTALANGATGNILVVTGTKSAHVRACDVSVSGAPCTINMYEDATTSADGTAVTTLINLNRLSSNASLAAMYYGATVTDNGTHLATTLVPSVGKDAGTIMSSFGEEIILKASSKYLLTLTNNSGGPINWGFKCFYYEIPDGYSV
jgi:hypothetical protein